MRFLFYNGNAAVFFKEQRAAITNLSVFFFINSLWKCGAHFPVFRSFAEIFFSDMFQIFLKRNRVPDLAPAPVNNNKFRFLAFFFEFLFFKKFCYGKMATVEEYGMHIFNSLLTPLINISGVPSRDYINAFHIRFQRICPCIPFYREVSFVVVDCFVSHFFFHSLFLLFYSNASVQEICQFYSFDEFILTLRKRVCWYSVPSYFFSQK